MTKGMKIALISLGVVAVGTTVTLLVVNSNKKKKEAEREKRVEQERLEKEATLSTSDETTGTTRTGYIVPKRNRNGEVINPLSEVKGKMLYPAQDSSKTVIGYEGGAGKATLRSSPEVNTGWVNNKITDFTGREPIGTIISAEKDNLDPPMRWFKVKMAKPCCGILTDYKEGYVRADVVTFNKYKKKSSSMSGEYRDMLTHYSPNLLGAEVFPHPNWLLPRANGVLVLKKDYNPYNSLSRKDFEHDMLYDLY